MLVFLIRDLGTCGGNLDQRTAPYASGLRVVARCGWMAFCGWGGGLRRSRPVRPNLTVVPAGPMGRSAGTAGDRRWAQETARPLDSHAAADGKRLGGCVAGIAGWGRRLAVAGVSPQWRLRLLLLRGGQQGGRGHGHAGLLLPASAVKVVAGEAPVLKNSLGNERRAFRPAARGDAAAPWRICLFCFNGVAVVSLLLDVGWLHLLTRGLGLNLYLGNRLAIGVVVPCDYTLWRLWARPARGVNSRDGEAAADAVTGAQEGTK